MSRRTAILLLALVAAVASTTPASAGASATAGAEVDEVKLLTPKKGGGIRPVLRWRPVEGVVTYLLVVQDKKGRAYWSWQGAETEVPMGGGEKPSKPGSGGPRVAKGYKWIVSAFGPNGELLAISKRRPISP
jgi:squalene cyclase